LTKTEATRVAQLAQNGLVRAIVPVHTGADGDVVYALATGRVAGPANVDLIGALAADVLSAAILRAVRAAKSIPGFPAASDMR
jgi:L-aminopeptidase/D-esterase-like protein